ncbi:CTP-transf-like domain-containing protein [Fusarium keratoplasticum]|uniref:CTP-transf-like domain-containing protein n=1 Tax=Fusarium keratoplasticum TaxID=1328300 RepID=A0ACC0QHH0_9HYPO|nr:CTP-transf-like domain-containing protein [Fusarium keratoplasticum]KAI8654835.1 CTP-transf-like domain-containing protein [Fusarium keratoplasticum]KAI8655680.1 CTP-transf-like domain-containing protein [Fusarium keratoplasticum]
MTLPRLGDYAERVHFKGEDASKSSNRPFNNGSAKNPPIVRPHGVNRILLYPGSFNPPHQGHLNLLRYVFENAGEDLHIIGAIIIMTDENRLEDKLCQEENPLILTRKERVNLWRGDGIPVDWVWVYDRPEASWADFRPRLSKEFSKDRLDVKFILLGGPDTISAEGTYNPKYWNCPDSITSDFSRPVDFRYPSTLRQLAGFSMWEKVSYDRRGLEQEIRAKMRGQPAQAIEKALTRAFATIGAVSICRRMRKPKGVVRFIPCNLEQRPNDAPSSTKIRQIIKTSPKDSLEDALKGIALNPKFLAEYIAKRPQLAQSMGKEKPKVEEKPVKDWYEVEKQIVW